MAARQPARSGHALTLEEEPSMVLFNLMVPTRGCGDWPGQPAQAFIFAL